MTDALAQRMADRLKALTEEERIALNEGQIAESERQHAAVTAAFAEGRCSVCGDGLDVFDEKTPCLHWFLRPAGVKKKHYPAVAQAFGMPVESFGHALDPSITTGALDLT